MESKANRSPQENGWEAFINSGLFDQIDQGELGVGQFVAIKQNETMHKVLSVSGNLVLVEGRSEKDEILSFEVPCTDVRPVGEVLNAYLRFIGRDKVAVVRQRDSETLGVRYEDRSFYN